MKYFIKNIAAAFDVRSGATQVGVVLYSTNAKTAIPLGSRIDNFKTAVDSLEHQRGSTRIDKALQLAANYFFTAEGGARDGIQKICLIITDGKQTKAQDAVELSEAVRPLKVSTSFTLLYNCAIARAF